jgi:DNA repair exonuclease SbcCD nuclease subunit
MRILHIADMHWRGLSRHDEYIKAFQNLFDQARDLQPDVIYVGGDIVHSKTQGISPELIDVLIWWFNAMAKIAPTHVILGNHDGLILNKDRQDAITPIITALNNDKIFLYKDSGTYSTGIPGFNWCVFSCFDEEGWKDVKPVEGEVNIALFHGAVRGSKTDVDWHIEGEVESSFFDGFDFALLGDIHKSQYLDDRKSIAYCGSTVQQNYGEDPGKGFLLWDIKSKDKFTSKFYSVEHDQPFVTIDWKDAVNETMRQPNCNTSKFCISV